MLINISSFPFLFSYYLFLFSFYKSISDQTMFDLDNSNNEVQYSTVGWKYQIFVMTVMSFMKDSKSKRIPRSRD